MSNVAPAVDSQTPEPVKPEVSKRPQPKQSADPHHGQRERFFVRIRFTEFGKVRFISHRDVARLFERALRKLSLPVAYSEGFSPRPKLSFGLALSVGYESEAEYLDVELTERVELDGLIDRFTDALPNGITVANIVHLEAGASSLQQSIVSCQWMVEILGIAKSELESKVASVLAATELPVERVRKGKTTVADIRPSILGLEVVGATDRGVEIAAHLATEQLSVRPSELLAVIGVTPTQEGRITRTHQWMTIDGERREPVSLPEPSNKLETKNTFIATSESSDSTTGVSQLREVS